jgi:hypothetical protein
MASINLSQTAQKVVAFLSATGAVGTTLMHTYGNFLPATWAAVVTSGLAVLAAVAGFIQDTEKL